MVRRPPEGERPITLQEVPVGDDVRVLGLTGAPSLRERLAELGLTPGQNVRVLRRAPLGDPVEIRVRGTRLGLRSDETVAVRVMPLDAPTVPPQGIEV